MIFFSRLNQITLPQKFILSLSFMHQKTEYASFYGNGRPETFLIQHCNLYNKIKQYSGWIKKNCKMGCGIAPLILCGLKIFFFECLPLFTFETAALKRSSELNRHHHFYSFLILLYPTTFVTLYRQRCLFALEGVYWYHISIACIDFGPLGKPCVRHGQEFLRVGSLSVWEIFVVVAYHKFYPRQ